MPIVKLGLPMAAAILATHAFLPPHPGPVAVAAEYGANVGIVLIYGIIVAIPTVIIAGIFYPKLAAKIVPSAFTRSGDIASLGKKKNLKWKKHLVLVSVYLQHYSLLLSWVWLLLLIWHNKQ